MSVRRGEVVIVDFQFSDGTGSKHRPTVVVQCNDDNDRLGSVIVAMITKRTQLVGREPRHILIDITTQDAAESGLSYNSVVNCSQLATVEHSRITRVVGHLSESLMARISLSLKECLGL